MKWPAHRTSINRTLQLAKREPEVQTVVTIGLLQHRGTTEILEDIIGLLSGQKWLLMDKLNELNTAADKVIKSWHDRPDLMEKPKHFPEMAHYRAITADRRKFVYCPVGNICSWNPGDYDHEWCHWCKKSIYEEPGL